MVVQCKCHWILIYEQNMMKQNFIPLQSMAYATKKKGVGLEYKTN